MFIFRPTPVTPAVFLPRVLAVLVLAVLGVACSDSGPADSGTATTSPWFTDISDEAGLDFVHDAAPDSKLRLPAVTGGGAAFLDYDNDGDLDIYLSNGDQVLPESSDHERGRNRLYRREADGRYTDVTAGSGLGDRGYGMGVAVGDIDNDGNVDVFVSNYGPDRLYRNQGDGSFADITSAAGARVKPSWRSIAAAHASSSRFSNASVRMWPKLGAFGGSAANSAAYPSWQSSATRIPANRHC